MSLGFGAFTQLMFGKETIPWAGVIGTAAFFALGLFISEVLFGWATEEDLQPNIDGLSFDEVLLGLFPGVAVVLVIRHLRRRRGGPPRVSAHS